MADFEFTDRYKALGIPYPDPETVCAGKCEGTGVYPVFDEIGMTAQQRVRRQLRFVDPPENSEADSRLWREAHLKADHVCDGWHFVKCPDCGGTGKRKREMEG